jgi:hypothetical protein
VNVSRVVAAFGAGAALGAVRASVRAALGGPAAAPVPAVHPLAHPDIVAPPAMPGRVRFAARPSTGRLHPQGVEVETVFFYTEADPFAVMAHVDPNGLDRKWVFSRDLLEAALLGRPAPARGDVVLTVDGDFLALSLTAPSGAAVIRYSLADVVQFAAMTHALVPFGAETADWEEAEQVFGLPPGTLGGDLL